MTTIKIDNNIDFTCDSKSVQYIPVNPEHPIIQKSISLTEINIIPTARLMRWSI